jgi:hypothetical protein
VSQPAIQALDVCIALLEPRATDPHHTQPSSPAGSATGLHIGSPGAGSGFLGGSPGGASLSASSELRRMSEVTAKVGSSWSAICRLLSHALLLG